MGNFFAENLKEHFNHGERNPEGPRLAKFLIHPFLLDENIDNPKE
jgi:hypothetical protein